VGWPVCVCLQLEGSCRDDVVALMETLEILGGN
jgi:hypothetical protein